MKNSLFCRILFLLIISSSVLSCSLDYGKNVDTKSTVPEMLFTDAVLKTYSDGKVSAELQAKRMEQYTTDNTMYASDVKFQTWNKKQETDTEGSCDLLTADNDTEKYTLIHNIKIYSESQDTHIAAENLHWDGKTEQLTSGLNDEIIITRDTTTLQGSGFTASGISGKFKFSGRVIGKIVEKQKEPAADEQ